MEERDKLVIGYTDNQYVALDTGGAVVGVFAPGAVFEVWMGGQWQAVRLESGGYRGYYYVTPHGKRGRFAVCMGVRLCKVPALDRNDGGLSPLEQVRLTWAGKQAQSKVPVASGYVCGEVLDVTDRGMVIFAYASPLNGVSVRAMFPVERTGDVLALVS